MHKATVYLHVKASAKWTQLVEPCKRTFPHLLAHFFGMSDVYFPHFTATSWKTADKPSNCVMIQTQVIGAEIKSNSFFGQLKILKPHFTTNNFYGTVVMCNYKGVFRKYSTYSDL